MSLSEKTASALEALGLTKTEIKAYAALLERGTMTANEVSRAARIPYSKVYQALEALHEKGWVERQQSRPILFMPKPPQAAMEELRVRADSQRKEKEQVALKELLGIYESKGKQERPDIWILRGTAEILSRVKDTVLNCRNELLIVLPTAMAPYAEEIAVLLMSLKEKGVKIDILTSSDLPDETLSRFAVASDVRTRGKMFGGGVVADAKEVVLLLGAGSTASSALAIWADHPGLAGLAREYFQFLWNSPETVRRTKPA